MVLLVDIINVFYNGIVSGQSSDYNPCDGVPQWLMAPYPYCTMFVYCYSGQPYGDPFSCPLGTLFNYMYQYCDWGDTCYPGKLYQSTCLNLNQPKLCWETNY